MIIQLLQFIYLMIPAYVANMTPVLARKIPWTTPLDLGITFRGKRVFGSHKTWRGLLLGVLAGTIIGFLFSQMYWPISVNAVYWSLLASFGALFGDLVKSFFKRQLNVKPGKSWKPFDQLDFAIGAVIFGSTLYFPGWTVAIFFVIISAAFHPVVNYSAYLLKIQKEKS
ncbi:CDP-diglyceride synthetase [Candidatus Woesearchaeota archaeon CG10_big_fil_rev_8_21_14_0_10_37_12]|nr:MAG: CDP-diglyceride synthetase [Candidatus Woesearchaeota archaeon CG10_big_fil_rev_8_21_14_0_10_37_12]